jgi:hypothetical protein
MLQFKELSNKNYMLCEDEYDLYKEWTEVIEARPRYINIMYGQITAKDEQAWNNDKNPFDDYSDNDRRLQAGIFPRTSLDVGLSSGALLLPRGGRPVSKF